MHLTCEFKISFGTPRANADNQQAPAQPIQPSNNDNPPPSPPASAPPQGPCMNEEPPSLSSSETNHSEEQSSDPTSDTLELLDHDSNRNTENNPVEVSQRNQSQVFKAGHAIIDDNSELSSSATQHEEMQNPDNLDILAPPKSNEQASGKRQLSDLTGPLLQNSIPPPETKRRKISFQPGNVSESDTKTLDETMESNNKSSLAHGDDASTPKNVPNISQNETNFTCTAGPASPVTEFILSDPNISIEPPLQLINEGMKNKGKSYLVYNLTVKHKLHGSVIFLGYRSLHALTNPDLGQLVAFSHGSAIAASNIVKVPMMVTLYNIKRSDIANTIGVMDREISDQELLNALAGLNALLNYRHSSYNQYEKTWTFIVDLPGPGPMTIFSTPATGK